MLDNDQEGVSGSNQWAPYSLGRRDVPPDNLLKKVRPVHISVKHLISVFMLSIFSVIKITICAITLNHTLHVFPLSFHRAPIPITLPINHTTP